MTINSLKLLGDLCRGEMVKYVQTVMAMIFRDIAGDVLTKLFTIKFS